MQSSPTLPDNVGARLLPSLIDEIASSDPERILYSITRTGDPADGFLDISAAVFARAANRCAWFIHKLLGGPGKDFPTVAYMGPQDITYAILVIACHKTGYAALFNSPRERLEVHLHLFDKTDCNIFLLPRSFPLPVVKHILAARPMHTLELPRLDFWLPNDPIEGHWLFEGGKEVPPYPYTKTFAEARLDPFVLLHTSGSTGMPKPITLTHGTVAPMDAFTALPAMGHQATFPALCRGTRVYLGVPFFHSAGLCLALPGCIYSEFTAVLGPFPPSPVSANAMHVHGNVQHSVLTPFTLIDMAKDNEHLENISRLKHLVFGGGQLPQEIGELLSSRTRLINCIGSTECGVFPIELCDPEDWPYLKVSPVLGQQYRHISGDLYEQVIVRELRPYQGIFSTYPDIQEWQMKDVYSKHPSKKNLFLYKGRADDIIVFSTGEKLNPFDMEGTILSNPIVKGALIAGFGRFQSSLLVETSTSPSSDVEKEAMMNIIWPSIEAANSVGPSFARIHRNMILFTTVDKPMPRASKGTPQRQLCLDLYAAELDALYAKHEATARDAPDELKFSEDLESSLLDILSSSTDIDVDGLTPETDLFEQGLDSLQVTVIARKLARLLQSHGSSQPITTRIIYSNPSIAGILLAIKTQLGHPEPTHTVNDSVAEMKRMYETAIADLPTAARNPQVHQRTELVVLLTGATGSLGSYILRSLIENASVSRVYCLNRGSGSSKRVQASQTAKGCPLLPAKVVCLDANSSQSCFGLSKREEYATMLNAVTTIIHAAWQVDFNLSLNSHRGHIEGVRRMIDFSAASRFGAGIFFVSSIGAVSNWRSGLKPAANVPEQVFSDWAIPQAMGYAESKFVAERLLDTASREAGIPAVICRVGQIAGPTTRAGIWPQREWFPSLLTSSKYLGKLPETLGRAENIDWIPVDLLGRIVVELALHVVPQREGWSGATVFHAANPKTASWSSELIPVIQRHIKVDVIPLERWLEELAASETADLSEIAQNPSVKLIEYFKSLSTQRNVRLDTTKTAGASPTLRGLDTIHRGWMENWMRQWAF
ncbi:hypothetical protein GGR57DRAFT_325304 [Xylariaceae sp. FL1272]|nr:hypothetical protein GGR57DRAFT_325304 [Xylariaceae sp. FL1272]